MGFLKTIYCCICAKPEPDAHHTEKSGMGLKGDDLSCIPLCREHHQELHQIGRKSFEQKHCVDLKDLNTSYLRVYIMYLERKKC